jgi:glyoxylase-like metal-dependent hydrolase (beta-lactamase superfamily II)
MRISPLVAALVFSSAAQAQSGTLDAVARAMGGKDRILAVRTLVMDGVGDNFNLGQNLTPSADLPRFEVDHHRRSLDFANKRWFVDQMRTPRFAAASMAPQRQRLGFDGVAFNVGNDGAITRAGGQAAVDRSNELMHHPIGFLQAAWAPGSEITEEAPRGQMRLVRINVGGNKFAILIDPVTSLPSRIQKVTYNAMLGDVTLETELSDWRDVDGLKLPMRFTQRLGERWTLSDMRLAKATLNADVADFGVPAEMRTQPAPAPAAPVVNVEEIVPGVWYLNGQTHHTVAIEQQRSIVLVEAPQSEERTLAVIERARTLVPSKPVDMVINTHHHFDHAGGIRAAINQGLTVLTHEGNRDFYERAVFPGRHFVMTDAQARNPKPLRLMALGDKYVRRDSLRTIETYHLSGNAHSGSMLVVYLPAERLLIQADLYAPPAANATAPVVFPFAANLLEHIQRRGLQVDRVIGIHGRVVSLSEIQAAPKAP